MSDSKRNPKDFQEKTAQRILNVFKSGQRRVLLADEVGLGKTIVARRVVELVRKWHDKELHDDFFKVVYICSNANIANQNIGKLGIGEENKVELSERRLAMLHLYLAKSAKSISEKAQSKSEEAGRGVMPESIVPITPATSFSMGGSKGTYNERALMYVFLRELSCFEGRLPELRSWLKCDVRDDAWKASVDKYEDEVKNLVDVKISVVEGGTKTECDYREFMVARLEREFSQSDLGENIISSINDNDNIKKSKSISRLRRIFAEISISMLDPDLVIMDEFQRFSSLLNQPDESEQAMLTRKFFDASNSNTKILLLSATPYKPYSTLDEIVEDGCDAHYSDFMNVMDFLFVDEEKLREFKNKWAVYSRRLKELRHLSRPEGTSDVYNSLLEAKCEAEKLLYSVVCRTERFNTGIIEEKKEYVPVSEADILAFAQGQHLIDSLEERGVKFRNMPIEYVKSAPYLLSFMRGYKLKEEIDKVLKSAGEKGYKTLEQDAKACSKLILKRSDVRKYAPISPANGKLQCLYDLFFDKSDKKETELLLWVPASNPYYKAGGVFETEWAKDFSKVIVFSQWEMVPRMISVMMSYYAEQRTFGKLKERMKNGQDERKISYFSKLSQGGLEDSDEQDSKRGGSRLKGETPLGYPCKALAKLFSPKEFYGMDLEDVRKAVRDKVSSLVEAKQLVLSHDGGRQWNSENLIKVMKMLDKEEAVAPEEFAALGRGELIDTLTKLSIASPAICAWRSSGDDEQAQKVGKAFVKLFNKPESAAVIDLLFKWNDRGERKSDDDYLDNVLEYCVAGNLQAVLDEYAFTVVTDNYKLGDAVEGALLDTSIFKVDFLDCDDTMRGHFALNLVDKSVTEKSATRIDNVRKAFNSPFRPFILSSTSVGQEGLDFHLYSRRIFHWNLPSNPVDLEQREGRINRFNCLSIRRNVAALYSDGHFHSWDELFLRASEGLKGDHSDMVPYWCLPFNDISKEQQVKLQKIQRIVPLYPLSRDEVFFERLKKVLLLYRLSLGQPRQEELLDTFNSLPDDEQRKLLIDLCPFRKES